MALHPGYEARRFERGANLQQFFKTIHEHSKEVGEPVESADDAFTRILGFSVTTDVGSGVHFQIPLTHLQFSLTAPLAESLGEEAAMKLRKLFMTAAGRAQLAKELTDGTWPGA